jgi:hypothetical protein
MRRLLHAVARPAARSAAVAALAAVAVLAQANAGAVQDPSIVPAPVAASAVVELALEAMGGRAAFDAITSHAMKGSQFKGLEPKEFPWELAFIVPDRAKGVQHSPIGPVIMVHDGTKGWVKAGVMKTLPADADQLAPMTDLATLPRLIADLESNFTVDESVNFIAFEGKQCYQLTMRRKAPRKSDGPDPHRLLIDVETSRPVAFMQSVSRPIRGTQTTQFRDWKEFGDVTLFTRTYAEERGIPVEFRMTSFEINKVQESEFAAPTDLEGGAGG